MAYAGAVFSAVLPSLFWYVLGIVGYGDWLWFIHKWPWSPKSQYGDRGEQFLLGAALSMAFWMWIPILVCIGELVGESRGTGRGRAAAVSGGLSPVQRGRAALLLLAVPLLGFFLMHGVLGSFGLFGSMALPRYFICVGPMAAVLGVWGMIWAEGFFRRENGKRGRARGRGVFVCVTAVAGPLFTLAALAYLGLLPAWPSQAITSLDVVIGEVKKRVPAADYEKRLILAHPYPIMMLGMPLGTPADRRVFDPEALRDAAVGTQLVIETQLWTNEGRPSFDQLRTWGWEEDAGVTKEADAAHPAIVFPLTYTATGQARLFVKMR